MSQSKNVSPLLKIALPNARKQAIYCSSALIWQRNSWQKTQLFTLIINLNGFNILQVSFAKTEGQFWGFHFLGLALNCSKVSISFMARGSNSQFFGPKWLKLSRPLWVDFTFGTAKSGLFCNPNLCCLFVKINCLIRERTLTTGT